MEKVMLDWSHEIYKLLNNGYFRTAWVWCGMGFAQNVHETKQVGPV